LNKKEASYITQIESLTRQNQVLFEENLQLGEKVGEQVNYSIAAPSLPLEKSSGDQSRLVAAIQEYSGLMIQKFDSIK